MNITLYGKSVPVDQVQAHIAPGGSLLYTLCGHHHTVAGTLQTLMLEVAFGLVDIERINDSDVKVHIYFGTADEPAVRDILSENGTDLFGIESKPLPENTNLMAYSMASRGRILQTLFEA